MCYVRLAGSGGVANPSLKDFLWRSDSYYVAKTGLRLVDQDPRSLPLPTSWHYLATPPYPAQISPIKTELFPPNPTQFVEAEETLIYAGKY